MSQPAMGPPAVCAAIALMSAACGSSHVMLQAPNTTPGARFTCTLARGCEPGQVDAPVRESIPGVVYLQLPDDCKGRFDQLVIYRADSSDPEIGVTCARGGSSSADSVTEQVE